MTEYHPSEDELIEYAAGNVDWAVGICISAHLHFCPECKARLAELTALGASCLESVASAEVGKHSLLNTMAKIRQREEASTKSNQTDDTSATKPVMGRLSDVDEVTNLPSVVKKALVASGEVKWASLSRSLKVAQVTSGQNKYEVCLHRIKKGGKVAKHDHRGKEITVVLEGSFSDEVGTYNPGDYIVKMPGDTHRPTAALNKDCLCLSIAEAPVKLSGVLGMLANPFLKIQPR